MGRSQRGLIIEKRGQLRLPTDLSKRRKRATKPAMKMKGSRMGDYDSQFKSIDLETLDSFGKSIIDVEMSMGLILFAYTESNRLKSNVKFAEAAMGIDNPTQDPIGYGEVLEAFLAEEDANSDPQPLAGIPAMTDGQIRQAVMVIAAGYCNLTSGRAVRT